MQVQSRLLTSVRLYRCIKSLYLLRSGRGCERSSVENKVNKELKTVVKLESGATCKYEEEKLITRNLDNFEWERTYKYRLLAFLETSGICDPTRLLECTKDNACECIGNSGIRESADQQYF